MNLNKSIAFIDGIKVGRGDSFGGTVSNSSITLNSNGIVVSVTGSASNISDLTVTVTELWQIIEFY